MIQRVLLFLLLGVFATVEGYGQRPFCGTPAPSPTEYRQLVLRLKNRGARTAVGPLVYVPVKFHIIRRSDGSGNDVSQADLNRALYWLNEQMAPANLQFYLSGTGVQLINSTADFENTDVQDGSYAVRNGARNAINVFVFSRLREGWAGYAYYPSSLQYSNCVFMNAHALKTQPDLLPHEIGHYFNLLHTHENNANEFAERVDGANCSTAGDLICDTPADPFGLAGATNQGCTYTGTVRDAGGKTFAPDLRNLMSYWHTRGCETNRFSAGQHERLYAGYLQRRANTQEYTLDERPALVAAPALAVERPNATTALLRWGAVVGAEGYLLERATTAEGPWRAISGLAAGTTQYTDGNLSAGTPFFYRLRASNSLNYSAAVLWRQVKTQQLAFDPIPNQTFGDEPVRLNARSSAGLPLRYRVVAGPAEIVSDTYLKLTGPGLIRVEAYQPGNGEYEPASVSQTCWADRMTDDVTFQTIADKTYGDSDFELNAQSRRGLPLTYALESGPGLLTGRRVRLTGAGTLRIKALHGGTELIKPAEQVLVIVIQKATQSLVFEPIPGKTYGDGPQDLIVRASTSLPTQVTVEGPAYVAENRLHFTGAGTVRVTARLPGNENYHAAPDITHTINVAKAAQTLRFDALPDRVYGQARFELSVRSSVGLKPTYTVTGPARIVDENQLEITGAGTVTVTAAQPGNENYSAAESQSQTFRVDKANQQISFAALSNKTYGDGPVPLSISLNSSLGLQLSVTGPAILAGSLLTLTGAGEVTVTAAQPGDANHHAAPSVTQTFRVEKASQQISFGPLPDRTYGDGPVPLSASLNSSLGLQLSVTGPAILAGSLLTLTGAGEVTVTAAQPGDDNHHAAATITQRFRIGKAIQLISFTPLSNKTYGEGPVPVNISVNSPLGLQLSVTGPAILAGSLLTLTGAGEVTVTAAQPGDDNHHAAATITQRFQVEKARQVISFPALSDRTYGDGPVPLSISLNSSLGLQLSVTGPAILAGSLLTLTGAGEVTVTAAQPGDANHHAAESITQRFRIDKRRQVLTLSDLPDRVYTPDPVPLRASSNSGRPFQYLVSGPAQLDGTSLRLLRAGTVTVQVVQSGDDNHYAADTLTRRFQVERAPQLIATTLPDLTLGTFIQELPLEAQPGLPLTYALVDGPATLTGTRLMASDYGRVTLTLNQPGDDRYLPAPEVRRSFCLNPAVPTVRIDPSSELTLVSSSPYRNQWLFNGDTLRGATDVRYAVTRAGTYTVVVSNPVAECASRVQSEPREIVISAVDEAVVAGFELYPNPGTDVVRVKVRTQTAGRVPTLSLHDALGRSISRYTLQSTAPSTYETELSVKGLSAGVYFLRVDAGGPGVTKRLVVQ